jgi:glycosyltransferase involved in cell wall biosynthesis
VGGTPGNADYDRVVRMIRALGLEENVEVVPPLSHFEMPSIYSASTVVAMTSEIEGLGKILLEAGAVGKPTVAPRVGGIPYVIDNGINGLMYRPGKLRDLRKVLVKIISHPKRARIMGKHARRNVLKKFAWNAIAHRFSMLFNELENRSI